jgi:phage tail sheath gpL-like
VKEHPVLMGASQLPKVLQILLEVYKTKFSTKELNNDIKTAFERMGQEKIVMICSGFKDTHKAKLEQMLRSESGIGGA